MSNFCLIFLWYGKIFFLQRWLICDFMFSFPWLNQMIQTVYITLRFQQNGPLFADDIFKFVYMKFLIFLFSSTEFCSLGQIGNKSVLVLVMAW